MTAAELIEKLKQLPGDTRLSIGPYNTGGAGLLAHDPDVTLFEED
jgi:hypothetical protein